VAFAPTGGSLPSSWLRSNQAIVMVTKVDRPGRSTRELLELINRAACYQPRCHSSRLGSPAGRRASLCRRAKASGRFSFPATISNGAPPVVGIENSVTVWLGVIAIFAMSVPASANHKLPSGPVVILDNWVSSAVNSGRCPSGSPRAHNSEGGTVCKCVANRHAFTVRQVV
jgi:hypothetical protein